MKITFLEEAKHELDEAIKYYDLQSPGLGQQFLQEILSTLDRVASFPKHGIHFQKILNVVKQQDFPTA